jgi:hypothetical protein
MEAEFKPAPIHTTTLLLLIRLSLLDEECESSWGTEPLIEPTYRMNFVWRNYPAAVSGTRTDSLVLMNLSNREFNRSLGVWRINYTRSKETKLRGLSVYYEAQFLRAGCKAPA